MTGIVKAVIAIIAALIATAIIEKILEEDEQKQGKNRRLDLTFYKMDNYQREIGQDFLRKEDGYFDQR